ncbi:MAG: sialidase family protein [Candidatus Baltobacteraceae bacterium]
MKSRSFIPILALGCIVAVAGAAQAQWEIKGGPPLVQLSADPFTNGGGASHATELEADTYAYGRTIVGTFQTGRYPDGGSSDIGWATSSNAGKTWKYGFLPGITKTLSPSNPYDRVSDPAVAYDAAHGKWLIASLPLANVSPAVIVSSSDDGLTWNNPVTVAGDPIGSDKNWITCDNTPTSPHFGSCYVEWDDGNMQIHMNVSSDGGATWGPTKSGGSGAFGLGGQPLAQPNGNVVVPFSDGGANILAIVSSDGGNSWSNAIEVATENDHFVSQMRAPSLPSAQQDANGTIYVVWHDCSFRANCAQNDVVMSTSSDGAHWSAKARIPIDPATSSIDHFTPGIGVDPKTAGASAHLGIIYNYFLKSNCTFSTCRLRTGFITSHNGGQTWGRRVPIAGPMKMSWLPNAGGQFVGDYAAVAFTSDGLAHSVFSLALAPGSALNEGAWTTASGQAVQLAGPQYSSRFERPYRNAHSDHKRLHYPPKKKLTKKVMEKD